MSIPLSDRVNQIPPSGIRKFFDLVMESKDIISLGVGEPDFLTPWHIREEAIYRIEKGHTSYTSNKGLEELRKEISHYLKNTFKISFSKDEILITNGVSEAVDIVCRTFINPKDEVILPEPNYVCYRPLIELCGGIVKVIDTSQSNFIPLAKDFKSKITKKTKAIVLSYPNNPTGQSIPFSELKEIASLAEKHNILIITDEIYADLSFAPFKSIAKIAKIKPNIIYLNGFSKAYSMTGWRIGYIAANEHYINAINKIHQYSALCAPTISQYAALEACKMPISELKTMKESYKQRSQFFTKAMNKIGLNTLSTKGGLYCFSSIKKTNLSSLQFAEKLIKEQKVAIVPGNVFGDCGEGYIRSCIAISFDNLKTAIEKIETLVNSI